MGSPCSSRSSTAQAPARRRSRAPRASSCAAATDGLRGAATCRSSPSAVSHEVGDVDALVVDVAEHGDTIGDVIDAAHARGLECVIRVRDEDELEEVLELVDPEILLLSAEEADDGQDHLERLLELLPDIPAGKLAIAELAGASRADVLELERAGVDAVIVSGSDVESLVGDTVPEV